MRGRVRSAGGGRVRGKPQHAARGLAGAALSRLARLDILRDFARVEGWRRSTAPESMHESAAPEACEDIAHEAAGDIAREACGDIVWCDDALLMDLYQRENAKSRPSWAPDLSVWKDTVHAFYDREEQTHEYLPAYKGYTGRQMQRMTHLEKFGETWILFDYQRRDPVTGNAAEIAVCI